MPLSVHGMLGGSWAPPGLSNPSAHAHELLFGYALAVVTGFLVNRLSMRRMLLLALLWVAGRVTFLALPGNSLALAANLGFALAVAGTAAPRFMKAAKKWRNRVIAPLILAICATAAVSQTAIFGGAAILTWLALSEAVLLFALLMLFFGGRLIAPAAAGAIEAVGGRLTARVQPRVEGALLILMGAALLCNPFPGLRVPTGAILIAAGALALVRLLRWRLWACRARPDLLCLGVGYAWLSLGLILLGLDRTVGIGTVGAGTTHAITVGALGTLTTNVMLRTRLLRLRKPPVAIAGWLIAITTLLALATIARILAGGEAIVLAMAAGLWCTALTLCLALLSRHR